MRTPSRSETLLPTRTQATEASYRKRGMAIAKNACEMFPGCSVLEALWLRCADKTWILCSATVRAYKAAILAFIEVEVAEGRCDPEEARVALADIDKLLKQRKGAPEPRTSRKKQKHATEVQFEMVIGELNRRAGKHQETFDALLQGIFEFGPQIGVRPCEWVSAAI